MDPALADQIRAYEIRLARTEARPALHAHLRAALIAQLAIAHASADGVDFLVRLRAAGCATTVANAPWLDRQAAQARVHAALGDPARAALHEAAARELAAASDAQAVPRMIACERRTLAAAAKRDAAGEAVGGIAMAVVDARAGRDREEKERYVAALRAVVGMRWHDAYDCAWLRARLPFDRVRWEEIGAWAGTEPEAVLDTEAEPEIETEAVAETGTETEMGPGLVEVYRAQLAWADPARKVVLEKIIALEGASDTEALRRMVEEDLELALVRATPLAQAEAGLARADARGQRHVAAHQRLRVAALRAATTVTELETELAWDDACFAVEATWWSVLVHVAAHGAAAAADLERLGTPDARRAVAAARATTAALLGASAGDVLAMPWMQPIVERILWGMGDVVDLPLDAYLAHHGETGHTALGPLRAAAATVLAREAAGGDPAELMARLRRPRAPDAAAFVARTRALLGPSPPTDPARRVVHLWGHAIDLAALHEADLVALRPRP